MVETAFPRMNVNPLSPLALIAFALSRAGTAVFRSTAAAAADDTLPRWRPRLTWRGLRVDTAWCWFTICLLLLLAGFLIGPRIAADAQRENCVGNVTLGGPFGINLNCDAPEFMALAAHPSGLLEPQNYRQSRPGMILAAAALTKPLSVIVPSAENGTPPAEDPARIVDAFTRYLPAYPAYMLLNAGILLLTFHFWRRTVRIAGLEHADSVPIVVAVGLMLVSNDVAKAFFWSPHTQMFNILAPVVAVYASLRAAQGGLADGRFAAGMGLLSGLGLTAYGVFALVPLCVACAGLLAWSAAVPANRRRMAANLVLLLALTALPTAIWYLLVRATVGSFFSAEVNEEAFVWMFRLWHEGFGVLAAEWLYKFWWMLRYAAPQALPLLVLGGGLLYVVCQKREATRATLRENSSPLFAAVMVSGAVLVFYTCVGWIFPRLAYPVLPPLILATGIFALGMARHLDPATRSILTRAVVLVAVANAVYEVAKDGPFS
jgi:hypothetical protein